MEVLIYENRSKDAVIPCSRPLHTHGIESDAQGNAVIVDKPPIQFIVEEAVRAGIIDILIITNRGKSIMEDHFDRAPELEERLLASGKKKRYDEVVNLAHLCKHHLHPPERDARSRPRHLLCQSICRR